MRCVYWNINQKNRKETISELFRVSSPDIVFLAEVQSPEKKIIVKEMEDRGFLCLKWIGDYIHRGFACYAKTGIAKDICFLGNGEYNLAVRTYNNDLIVGIWSKTEKNKTSTSYCKHVKNIFDSYKNEKNVIFIGDFNSSPNVKGQKRVAIDLFKYIDESGYESLYHYKSKELLGYESSCTYKYNDSSFFMLDYVVANKSMVDKINFRIAVKEQREWLNQKGHSDHVPIEIEV